MAALIFLFDAQHFLEPIILLLRRQSEHWKVQPSANMAETPDIRSDAELLSLSLAGDESAFLALYRRLKDSIFRYAFYMTNSSAAAEEVTQEVFMSLLHEAKLGKYVPERGDVGAFAFGIARNLVRRMRRRERAYEPLLQEDVNVPISGTEQANDLQQDFIRGERAQQVQAAIASLPERYAQVVVLCDLCELSYMEAAARLGCPVGTIRSRLSRAHVLLAKKLKPLRGPEPQVRTAGTEGCLI